MAKYKVGDTFIATITEIDNNGMGLTYVMDDAIIVNESQLANLEPCSDRPNLTENEFSEPKAYEYTLDELQERIFVISDLLHRTTEAYRQARASLKNGIETADSEVGRLNV